MSTQTSQFDLGRGRRNRYLLLGGAVVVVIAVIVAVVLWPDSEAKGAALEKDGAELVVVTQEANAPEEALIKFIADKVAPDYGIKVGFKGLSDSTTLNRAVSEGEVAGTIYQHKLWLKQVLEANPDFKEKAAAPVFRWSFGIWSAKYKSVGEIPQNATISLYSDPANEAQGLWLLERAGLIKLKPGVDKWTATVDDIGENPKRINFKLLDFSAQTLALPDLDAAVGYTEYYLNANKDISQQIYAPAAPDEFAGQLTIGTRWENSKNIQNLVKAFKDPRVQEFLRNDPRVKNILLPL